MLLGYKRPRVDVKMTNKEQHKKETVSCEALPIIPAMIETGGAHLTEAPVLTDAQLEAGARAVSVWRSLGGFEYLGSYDLVRRVVGAVLEAAQLEQKAKP